MLERWHPHSLLLGPTGLWDGQQWHADLDTWCRLHAGAACTVWLSSALLYELVCEPGLPLADDAAALQWAQGVLQYYHGETAAAWPLAAWSQGAVRGVSALRGASLDSLKADAQRSRVRLRGVRPWWSLVLCNALRRHAELRRGLSRLLIVEGERLVVVELEQGRVEALRPHRLDAADPELLRPWADLAPQRPTLAVGYGMPLTTTGPVRSLNTLDGAGPADLWLAAA